MNKTVRTIAFAGALAVMIPLSAYAATSGSTSSSGAATTPQATQTAPEGKFGHGFGKGAPISQEILDLLKLDKATFQAKAAEGKTLAQIAEAQGVSRDALKKALTDEFNKREAAEKQSFTDNLDKLVDSQPLAKPDGFRGGIEGKLDLTAAAKALGITEADARTGLQAGKSLADLATEKKVDVKTVVAAVKASIDANIKAAVTAGKLTQAEADKLLANTGTQAENIVNAKGGLRGGFGGGGHGHGRGGHRGGFGEDFGGPGVPDGSDSGNATSSGAASDSSGTSA